MKTRYVIQQKYGCGVWTDDDYEFHHIKKDSAVKRMKEIQKTLDKNPITTHWHHRVVRRTEEVVARTK